MPKPLQSFALRDFTGGLNLRADQFQLGTNESPDLLNMDIDPRGGLKLRAGIAPWGSPLHGDVVSMGAWYGADGERHVVAQVGTGLKFSSDGETWLDVRNDNTVSTPHSYASFKDALYVQNGTDGAVKWDGTTGIRLGAAYSNDIGAPTTGNMPIGKVVVAHNGYVFVANTLEGGVRHRTRVRFSHPNQPESFRSVDWFDIEPGVDGDEIVAMVPFSDHLVVFKRRSTFVVFGFDADSFQVQAASRDVGAVSMRAVTTTPQGVYFFSERSGVMFYDGRSIDWRFDKLIPALDGGDIDRNRLGEVTSAWLGNRVWFQVPWLDGVGRTLIYDPSLGKYGAWTQYQFCAELGAMLAFGPLGGMRPLGAFGAQLADLDVDDQPWDDLGEQTAPEPRTTLDPLDEPDRQTEFLTSLSLVGLVEDEGTWAVDISFDATVATLEYRPLEGLVLDLRPSGGSEVVLVEAESPAEANDWLADHPLVANAVVYRTLGAAAFSYDWEFTSDDVVVGSGSGAELVTPGPYWWMLANWGWSPTGVVVQGTPTWTVQPAPEPIVHHIESRYVTPWVDAGEIAIRKRWRRPWFVFLGETDDVVEVSVFSDFDGAQRTKTFYEAVSRAGSAPRWGQFDWDDGSVWGGEGKSHSIERGSTLGLSRAVQLAFRGPQSNAIWGLDNITFTFIPRKLR